MSSSIGRVLIANRGEIAVRVARTCQAMGIGTVGVFSDPDAHALHVAAVDEAVRLPGASPGETYLQAEKLIAAAHRTGADAVHPGYGFLSENAAFARAVAEAGLIWVGPSPEAIAAMGDKLKAKELMSDAAVPLLPSAELDDDATDDDLAAAAEYVGFPVMVKAAAGGGGKGMRVVEDPARLADEVAAARREATGAFGDGRVFLERFLVEPRHVEIQILGDHHGNLVHLFERECSIQRRHQKIVEETPSTAVDDKLRDAMGAAAVAAGKAIGYTNAGTVEFIVDRDGNFHFLEVNTRLQVEHPVTEAVTGLDLVRLQLLVAEDVALPFDQDGLSQSGHAIEVRLYAEDPANSFLPATGTLVDFAPAEVAGVRWDAGVQAGSVISTYYDPLLAKVIAHAPTRVEAAGRLARALELTPINGVTTNRDFLVATLRDDAFLAGDTTTSFIDRQFPTEADRRFPPSDRALRDAAVAVALARAEQSRTGRPSPATVPPGFTNTLPVVEHTGFDTLTDDQVAVAYHRNRDGTWTVTPTLGPPEDATADGPAGNGQVPGSPQPPDGQPSDDQPADAPDDAAVEQAPVDTLTVVVHRATDTAVDLEVDGHRQQIRITTDDRFHHVMLPTGAVTLIEQPRFPDPEAEDVPGAAHAPMPGAVVDVAVTEGQDVTAGQLLVTLEAMKMEHRITAPFDGIVTDVRVAPGDQVDADEILVVVQEPADDEPAEPPVTGPDDTGSDDTGSDDTGPRDD